MYTRVRVLVTGEKQGGQRTPLLDSDLSPGPVLHPHAHAPERLYSPEAWTLFSSSPNWSVGAQRGWASLTHSPGGGPLPRILRAPEPVVWPGPQCPSRSPRHLSSIHAVWPGGHSTRTREGPWPSGLRTAVPRRGQGRKDLGLRETCPGSSRTVQPQGRRPPRVVGVQTRSRVCSV